MAKVRVYELAKEFGLESVVVMARLREMGEAVPSASSTLEAPVVRRLEEAFRSAQPAGLPRAPESTAYRAPAAERSHPEPPATRNSSEEELLAAIAADRQEPASRSASEARTREQLTASPDTDRLLVLNSWQVLKHLAPDPDHAVAFLAEQSGLHQSTIDQVRRVRNHLAHARDVTDWPDPYDIEIALATARELRGRLKVSDTSSAGLGLPIPNQPGTGTGRLFPSTTSASADIRQERTNADEAAPAPVRIDHLRAMHLLIEAERLAWSITDNKVRASALASIATAMADSDPDRAEHLARSITDNSVMASALTSIAQAVAGCDPDRAERLAESITDRRSKASALAGVAQAVAVSDPDRAKRLIDAAESIRRNERTPRISRSSHPRSRTRDPFSPGLILLGDPWYVEAETALAEVAEAVARVAQTLATADPDRTARLIDDWERFAQSITEQEWQRSKASTLAGVALAVAAADPGRAARLIDDAERAARSITDQRSKASTLAAIAQTLAASDPDRAARLAESITDLLSKASALAGVAQALAASDPDRAARLIDDAERAARSITGQRWEAEESSALARVARALAEWDADRAERIARSITSPGTKASALAGIAQALAASDPDRAERIAQSITDDKVKASALAAIAQALAASDPNRAERIAQLITSRGAKVSVLVCIAKIGLQGRENAATARAWIDKISAEPEALQPDTAGPASGTASSVRTAVSLHRAPLAPRKASAARGQRPLPPVG